MAAIIYNGITIYDVLTEGITQQVQYDSSGRDAIFVRSQISCRGTVYATDSPTLPRNFGKRVSSMSGLAPELDRIMGLLLQPKKEFRYKLGSKDLFHVTPATGVAGSGMVVDMNNGPKPSARWLNIIGDKSATVQFTVEVATYMCGNGGQPSGVTNYHFWVADEWDANWFTTRTFQGQLRISSLNFSVHQFRALALPRLAPGFVRESVNFQESPDGMSMDFHITDREVYATPPRPATKWRAHHALSFPHVGMAYAESEVRLTLETNKDTPKDNLIALAYKILVQKLHLADLSAGGRNLITSASFGDDMTGSGIESHARVMHMDKGAFTGALQTLGRPLVLPGYVPDEMSHPVPTATLSGVFFQAINQDPCNAYSDLQLKPLQTVDYRLDTKQPIKQSRKKKPAEQVPGSLQPLRDPTSQNYAQYRITSSISTRSGNVVLPIASSASSTRTSVSVSLFPAQTTRTIHIEGDRLNQWPEIPLIGNFTDNNGIVNTLICHHPTLESVKLSVDGAKALYGLTGDFIYQLSRAPKSSESLPAGVPAYVTKNSPLILQSLSPNYMFNPTGSKLA